MAPTAAALNMNELGEGSLDGLRLGIAALADEQRAKVNVHAGSAAGHAVLVSQSDFVIADPPRKGLDVELTRALVGSPPERFVYVSCDIDSFERDAGALLGAFRLELVEAYDLFPHTEHIETLAMFARR
jgi:23S rRNA (uracil1939-C5)-methyltransferase